MKAYKIVLFILSIKALLILICVVFPEKGIPFGERRLFFPTLEEVMVKEKRLTAREKLEILEAGLRIQFVLDSTAQAEETAFNDSVRFYLDFFNHHPARFYLPNNDYSFFDSLFYRLDNCKNNNELIHILHYGDSQIEGDRITGFIRQKLQEHFGGKGPGLIPAIQPIPSASVEQSTSGNMERFTISGNFAYEAEHNRYGVLGQISVVHGNGAIHVATRNYRTTFENVRKFSKVRVFLNRHSENFTASLQIGENEPVVQSFPAENLQPVSLTWKFDRPTRRFELWFSGNAEISAISLDGNAGVAVDNIPLRGSSGTFFTQLDVDTYLPVLHELNVRLILLQFGGNAIPAIRSERSVDDFTRNIARQISHLKNIYPAAQIVFIGPSDMSTTIDGRLQTFPFLKETVQRLREAALDNGAAFWSIFDVMGGENSMIDWVNNQPAWASSDYIHFTERGSAKIAEMFYESLMNYYSYAQFMNNYKQQ
jgi:lysophospholipase L1-like esterase